MNETVGKTLIIIGPGPTPTPWHVGPHYKTDIESREGRIGECGPMGSPRAIANAAFIVEAVNSHEALRAALDSVVAIALEAFKEWDADRDMRVGKILLALAGEAPGYRADIDAIHAVRGRR